MTDQLISIVQMPVLEAKIQSLKAQIQQEVQTAKSLAVTEDTLIAVKETRARLRKQYAELEEQKRSVRDEVFQPWNAFLQIYDDCVTFPFREADLELKGKISAVEGEIKRRAEEDLREYFAELCAANHTQWLTYELAAPKLGLAEARQKTLKKSKDLLREAVERVAKDEEAISKMEHGPEIMAEYAQCLDLARAVSIVKDRLEAVERQKDALEATRKAHEATQEAVAKVEALAPPKAVEAPQRLVKCTFTVHATVEQLKELKNYLNEREIKYE